MDVEVLPELDVSQLLYVDFIDSQLVCVIPHVLVKLWNRLVVHEVPCIYRVIRSIFFVGAELASPHQAGVLDVVDHQTSIVNYLCDSACVKYLLVLFDVFDLDLEAVSDQESEWGPPLLASSVKQIVQWIENAFIDGFQVCFLIVLLVLEKIWSLFPQLLRRKYFARDDFFKDSRLVEQLAVFLQQFFPVLNGRKGPSLCANT